MAKDKIPEKPKLRRWEVSPALEATEAMVVNTKTEVAYTQIDALVEILNRLHKIQKRVDLLTQ